MILSPFGVKKGVMKTKKTSYRSRRLRRMTQTLKFDTVMVFIKFRQNAMPRRSCKIQIHLSSFLYTTQTTATATLTAANSSDLAEKSFPRNEKLQLPQPTISMIASKQLCRATAEARQNTAMMTYTSHV
uniref:Uncharacterized protein n=1 Tax=Anguilla anguilla TaxID=7936 RepID=A0A0E9XGX9_ANGAN